MILANKLKVLDLFSGIGGFSLGLEWTGGFETVAFCEIEKFPQQILKKHWPDVPIYEDVRTLDYDGTVDVITGGYPCQPFSLAGKRKGAEDDRHLWPAMFSLIQKYRPAWVIGENVAGHINMGLDSVLADLESEGYRTRTFVIPACAVDAKHRRDRLWIVGHSKHDGSSSCGNFGEFQGESDGTQTTIFEFARSSSSTEQTLGNTKELFSDGIKNNTRKSKGQISESGDTSGKDSMANTERRVKQAQLSRKQREILPKKDKGRATDRFGSSNVSSGTIWLSEPELGRVVDGLPRELDIFGELNESSDLVAKTKGENPKSEEDFIKWKVLRAMWENRDVAEASPELYEERLRDIVPEMPRCGTHEGWFLGCWIEKDKGLRDMWEAFYAKPFEEAQDLQQNLLERIRQNKRTKTVGPTKDRANRLKALGNAVVPQIPYIIGQAILEAHNE